MIFRQWQQVLDGTKTQTRRLMRDGWCGEWKDGSWRWTEYFHVFKFVNPPDDKRRILYYEDQLLPVIPKRALPATRLPNGEMARIRVLGLRQEYLQDISEADALAEGVNSVEAYKALWESINGKTTGARWADNPQVLVITFEMATQVVTA